MKIFVIIVRLALLIISIISWFLAASIKIVGSSLNPFIPNYNSLLLVGTLVTLLLLVGRKESARTLFIRLGLTYLGIIFIAISSLFLAMSTVAGGVHVLIPILFSLIPLYLMYKIVK